MTRDDDPRRADDAPLELELADVPRRLPRGGVHGADLRDGGADLRGGGGEREPMVVDEPTSAPRRTMAPTRGDEAGATVTGWEGGTLLDQAGPWLRGIVSIVVVIGAIYVAYRVYQRFNRPDVVAIGSPYRSSAGVTIELPPGGGWRTARSGRFKRSMGNAWVRGDVIFRGPSALAADELAVLVRLHAPGGFARTIDRETLRTSLERTLQQQAAAAGATTRNLACVHEDGWQQGIGEVCYGRIAYGDRDIGAGAYLWVVGDDDLIGIVYATDDVSLDALELMAKSAR